MVVKGKIQHGDRLANGVLRFRRKFSKGVREFIGKPTFQVHTAPAQVVIREADEFRDKTSRPNELWQTDFTYRKVIGWGWF